MKLLTLQRGLEDNTYKKVPFCKYCPILSKAAQDTSGESPWPREHIPWGPVAQEVGFRILYKPQKVPKNEKGTSGLGAANLVNDRRPIGLGTTTTPGNDPTGTAEPVLRRLGTRLPDLGIY